MECIKSQPKVEPDHHFRVRPRARWVERLCTCSTGAALNNFHIVPCRESSQWRKPCVTRVEAKNWNCGDVATGAVSWEPCKWRFGEARASSKRADPQTRPTTRHVAQAKTIHFFRRLLAAILLSAVFRGLMVSPAPTQPYPGRHITLIVPFAPGGADGPRCSAESRISCRRHRSSAVVSWR